MAGSPAKMLEHLLETRLDGRDRSSVDSTGRRSSAAGDTDSFLEEFLMTHIIFMPIHQLLTELTRQYPFHTATTPTGDDGENGSKPTSPTSAANNITYRLFTVLSHLIRLESRAYFRTKINHIRAFSRLRKNGC